MNVAPTSPTQREGPRRTALGVERRPSASRPGPRADLSGQPGTFLAA